MDLTARVHQEDGSYWAEVVELPGCFASGDDLDELKEALAEAIFLYQVQYRTAEGAHDGESDDSPSMRIDELKLAVPA